MQFNRSAGQKYVTKLYRDSEENTLEIEIKQNDVSASELNVHVKKFSEENKMDKLDSNSLQLIIEELVVMVLLPKLKAGSSIQCMISYNHLQGIIKMGLGYPGENYNPFEMDYNIFMLNILREWIADIHFENSDNCFNELVLTLHATKNDDEFELENLVDEVPEADAQVQTATKASNGKGQAAFSFLEYEIEDKTVEPGTIVQNTRQQTTDTWEILIRDKKIDKTKWYQYLGKFFDTLELQNSRIIFDSKVNTAESAIKSVSRVVLFDVLEHCMNYFTYIACRASLTRDDGEFIFRLRYPGEKYNPFEDHSEDGRIQIINRQSAVVVHHLYQNELNEITIYFSFVK